jgi:hypothetical protein
MNIEGIVLVKPSDNFIDVVPAISKKIAPARYSQLCINLMYNLSK